MRTTKKFVLRMLMRMWTKRSDNQRDTTIIALLKEAKFWFGTEFESKTPAEQHGAIVG